LRHFRLLDALGEMRNVHRAAESLCITQSAATKTLAEIEGILGVPLFERTRRGVLPTESGRILIERARRVLCELELTREDLDGIIRGHAGLVRIGAFSLAAVGLVPKTIKRMEQMGPRIRILLQEAPPAVLLSALRRGELDLVVGRIPAGEEGIGVEFLYDQSVAVVVSVTHPLAHRSEVDWEMLTREEWILPPRGGAARIALEATLARYYLPMPPARVETMSIVASEALVEQGLVALLPLEVAQHLSERHRVAILPLSLDVAMPPIGVAWEKGRQLTSAASLFLLALRTEAATKSTT
jgi:DNA-binding transcriptional LysR family regulator